MNISNYKSTEANIGETKIQQILLSDEIIFPHRAKSQLEKLMEMFPDEDISPAKPEPTAMLQIRQYTNKILTKELKQQMSDDEFQEEGEDNDPNTTPTTFTLDDGSVA